MKDSFDKIFKDVKRVLVFTAHPDDLDIMCGGTIARLAEEGKKISSVICTNGAFGSRENEIDMDVLAGIRNKEQKNSARKLGISEKDVHFLSNNDCTLIPDDNEFIERIVYHMRKFRPDFIITHDPLTIIKTKTYPDGQVYINHRDHRAVGGAVVNAILPMARDVSFFPEHKLQGLEGIVVKKFMVDNAAEPNAIIEIFDFIEKKRAAMTAHKSQLDADKIEELIERNKAEDGKYYEKFKYFQLAF